MTLGVDDAIATSLKLCLYNSKIEATCQPPILYQSVIGPEILCSTATCGRLTVKMIAKRRIWWFFVGPQISCSSCLGSVIQWGGGRDSFLLEHSGTAEILR